jgi:hypothetical protein
MKTHEMESNFWMKKKEDKVKVIKSTYLSLDSNKSTPEDIVV